VHPNVEGRGPTSRTRPTRPDLGTSIRELPDAGS
jgi:hypothetical protein